MPTLRGAVFPELDSSAFPQFYGAHQGELFGRLWRCNTLPHNQNMQRCWLPASRASVRAPSRTRLTVTPRILMLACAAFLLAGGGPAPAQDLAGKSMRIIVPFPAGGTADVIARLVSQ